MAIIRLTGTEHRTCTGFHVRPVPCGTVARQIVCQLPASTITKLVSLLLLYFTAFIEVFTFNIRSRAFFHNLAGISGKTPLIFVKILT